MVSAATRFLAIASAFGLAASLVAYLASFFGVTLESSFKYAFVLHIGFFALLSPMFATERSGIRDRSFFWSGFAQGQPDWAVPTIKALGLFLAINFALFLIQSHAASPEIRDGQYVLNDHGAILRTITKLEYLRLKGSELRLFASGWMFFYFVPTAYWWFPRPETR
ncbi:MAG TPA: hypothetical protein VIY53_04915 [Acidobacteriaceae bacterium]